MSVLHLWLEGKIEKSIAQDPKITVISGMTVKSIAERDATDVVGKLLTTDELVWYRQFVAAKGWTISAKSAGDKWRVTKIDAKRELGQIRLMTEGEPQYRDIVISVNESSALYQPESSGYKNWVWSKMQEDETVLTELYEIANGAYVGCDVYVDGPNAAGVVAAAKYVLKEYAAKMENNCQ